MVTYDYNPKNYRPTNERLGGLNVSADSGAYPANWPWCTQNVGGGGSKYTKGTMSAEGLTKIGGSLEFCRRGVGLK